jgi:hypothetical protein
MAPLLRCACLIAFFSVVLTVGQAGPATAQCPPPPGTSQLAEGEIGLFFSPQGTENCTDNAPTGIISLYVVARVPEGGVAQFSIPELRLLTAHPQLIVLAPISIPPGGDYEQLIVVDACGQARRVNPATCPVAQGDLLVISLVEVMALSPVIGTVCFETVCPTIAGIVAMAPFYNRCDTGTGGSFSGGEIMCIGFGEEPVPAGTHTWGAIKAIYVE